MLIRSNKHDIYIYLHLQTYKPVHQLTIEWQQMNHYNIAILEYIELAIEAPTPPVKSSMYRLWVIYFFFSPLIFHALLPVILCFYLILSRNILCASFFFIFCGFSPVELNACHILST